MVYGVPKRRVTWPRVDTSAPSHPKSSVWAVGCVLGIPKMQKEPAQAVVRAERNSPSFPLQGCKTAALEGGTTSLSYVPCTRKQWLREICIFGTLTITLKSVGFFFLFFCKHGKCLCSREKVKKPNKTPNNKTPQKCVYVFSGKEDSF